MQPQPEGGVPFGSDAERLRGGDNRADQSNRLSGVIVVALAAGDKLSLSS
jgi:hypothetical protein